MILDLHAVLHFSRVFLVVQNVAVDLPNAVECLGDNEKTDPSLLSLGVGDSVFVIQLVQVASGFGSVDLQQVVDEVHDHPALQVEPVLDFWELLDSTGFVVGEKQGDETNAEAEQSLGTVSPFPFRLLVHLSSGPGSPESFPLTRNTAYLVIIMQVLCAKERILPLLIGSSNVEIWSISRRKNRRWHSTCSDGSLSLSLI